MARQSKGAAATVAVPQTREEVAEAIAAIGRAQRERTRIEAGMGDALAQVRAPFEQRAQALAAQIDALHGGVQIWCAANRDALTGGKSKTATFPTGTVAWRTTPPRVVLKGIDGVLRALKLRGLHRFVRQKEEVNREALLAEPETAATVPGVRIEQDEEFIVTPHEAALAEGT